VTAEPPDAQVASPDGSGDVRPDPVEVQTSDLRRLHPLTPLFHSWRLVGLAGALGFGAFRDDFDRLVWVWHALHGDADIGLLMRAFLVVSAAAAASVALGWLSWRATGFAIVAEPGDPGTLLYHRGLFNRQRSQVRLKRVQSVDVNQPFLPRLLGLAAVSLDMAAGEDASVNLSYLSLPDAWALREEILRHTSVSAVSDAGREASTTAVPDQVIGHVETAYLVKASLLDGAWVWLLLVLWVVAVVVLGLLFGWQALAAGVAGIVPVTIAILVQLRQQVATILRDADFTVMRTPTGIRTRAGLTSTANRTIDVDRVQALRVERPLLWRRLGWARVSVDVAGTANASGASLMPVADDPVALRLASDVAGELIEPAGSFRGPGRRARVLDPFTWRWIGVALLEHGAVSRTGWLTRKVSYVPYARIQSVSIQQGWLQRRLRLATVCLDLPSGAQRWLGPHRDVGEAAVLVARLSEAARQHRKHRQPRQPRQHRQDRPAGPAERGGNAGVGDARAPAGTRIGDPRQGEGHAAEHDVGASPPTWGL
jgi:putative membrane protein